MLGKCFRISSRTCEQDNRTGSKHENKVREAFATEFPNTGRYLRLIKDSYENGNSTDYNQQICDDHVHEKETCHTSCFWFFSHTV